jgi:hypothetical protein
MPQTMPKPRARHKFAAYWQTVSPTARADFPQEPWQLLRPDESVVRLEVDLQNATRADVARRVSVTRSAVTNAHHRLQARLSAITAPAPPLDPPAALDSILTIEGLDVAVSVRGAWYTAEPVDPSAETLMCRGDPPAFCDGFGGLSREDWGQRRQERADRAFSHEHKGEGFGPRGRSWAQFVGDQVNDARRAVQHYARHALDAEVEAPASPAVAFEHELMEGGFHYIGDRGEGGMRWDRSDLPTNRWIADNERLCVDKGSPHR